MAANFPQSQHSKKPGRTCKDFYYLALKILESFFATFLLASKSLKPNQMPRTGSEIPDRILECFGREGIDDHYFWRQTHNGQASE